MGEVLESRMAPASSSRWLITYRMPRGVSSFDWVQATLLTHTYTQTHTDPFRRSSSTEDSTDDVHFMM